MLLAKRAEDGDRLGRETPGLGRHESRAALAGDDGDADGSRNGHKQSIGEEKANIKSKDLFPCPTNRRCPLQYATLPMLLLVDWSCILAARRVSGLGHGSADVGGAAGGVGVAGEVVAF